MTSKTVAPYGEWESPISVESVATGARGMSCPRVCPVTGRVYFLEGDGTGRVAVMQLTDDGAVDILPKECSIGNDVYEYGITLLEVLPDGRIMFSNRDGTVRILDPSLSKVTTVLESSPVLRHGSFTPHQTSPWVLAIQEDHTEDTPTTIKNYIVAINIETGDVKRVISGADFYFQPRLSPDGTRVVWLEWNHPEMLFDMSRLFIADFDAETVEVKNQQLISGGNNEGTCEPRWGPDSALYFSQETGGRAQLFRIAPEGGKPVHLGYPGLEKFDIGEAALGEASRTYAPLSSRHIVAFANDTGISYLVSIDLEEKTWKKVAEDQGICALFGDCVAKFDESSFVVTAKCYTKPVSLFKVSIYNPADTRLLRTPGLSDVDFDDGLFSRAESITIPSRSEDRPVHGFLYMPLNSKFTAPEGELPPLVVYSHGGPTYLSNASLAMRTQYFTTRGYAYLTVNYVGSTGYGSAYRRALYGRWGVSETNDLADFAVHLVETGRVRPGVGVTGHSAGGYSTLQALTLHPTTFAGGVCAAGICDLVAFNNGTHKLEFDYTEALVVPEGTPKEEVNNVLNSRSARYHADKIQSPLLIIHGLLDMVVPIDQARLTYDIVKNKGGDVKLVEVEGDSHMLMKLDSVRVYLTEEEQWWRKTLLKI